MVTPETCQPDTLALWNFLPKFVRDADAAADYIFLTWLDGTIAYFPADPSEVPSGLQIIDDLCRDDGALPIVWTDPVGNQQAIIDSIRATIGSPGWSAIMDVTRCPTYALPWLAQFVGVRFTSAQVGNDTAMRQAIALPSGFARGTVAAIEAVIAPFLDGGTVNIIERYNGNTNEPDPYAFVVEVNGALLAMSYAELAALYATYTDVATAFPLYSDFPTTDTGLIEAAIIAATPGGLIPTIEF